MDHLQAALEKALDHFLVQAPETPDQLTLLASQITLTLSFVLIGRFPTVLPETVAHIVMAKCLAVPRTSEEPVEFSRYFMDLNVRCTQYLTEYVKKETPTISTT